MGMSGDQTEATIFAVKHPSCATTIIGYTVAQDYSLVGFIGTLKISKLQSLPKILPINKGNCKEMQPIRMAYEFIDRKGDDYLGKSTADYFRTLLATQINEGKAAIDAQIAAIPYVGTIITNWDCECDAAFETNFPAEKMADDIVGSAISIVSSVKNGEYGQALEKMISKFGPDLACKIASEYTGVGSIPIVSDTAEAACSKVAGKVVGWVVSGAGTLAKFAGLVGGDHIPFEQYYAQMFTPELAKDGYMELANILYGKCYTYFEPTNLSADNSKEVCAILRDRYVNESIGKIQWNAYQLDRTPYYNKNMKPIAASSALLSADEFQAKKYTAAASCKTYFNTMYPKATAYATAYGGEAIDTICDSFISFYKDMGASGHMDTDRLKAQNAYFYELEGKLSPLCSKGERNQLKCENGPALSQCQQQLPKACVKAGGEVAAWLGGMELPCCVGGGSGDSVFKFSMDIAAKRAAESGGYCKINPADPLNIYCTIEDAYKKCMQQTYPVENLDCSQVKKSGTGAAKDICCSFDPDKLSENAGAVLIKTIVDELNAKQPDNCSIGGAGASVGNDQATLTNDPQVAYCCDVKACQARLAADMYVKTSKFNIADTLCKGGPAGYVVAPCCQKAVFCATPEKPYDPSQRSKEELALAAKAVADSNGNCSFGKTADGKEDLFKIVCKTMTSGKACYDTIGRSTWSGCQITKSGYVKSPCCALSPDAYAPKISADDAQKMAGEKPIDKGKVKTDNTKLFDKDAPKDKHKKLLKEEPKKNITRSNQKLVSVKLLSLKPKDGVTPFNIADVKGKIGGDKGGKKSLIEDAAKGKKAPAAEPSPDHNLAPNTPEPSDALSKRTTTAPAGFSCEGKPDGNYCKDDNTQVFCYHNAIANSQDCPSGCNQTTGSCNAYKP